VDLPESLLAYKKVPFNPELSAGVQGDTESDLAFGFKQALVKGKEALTPGSKASRDLSPYYRDYHNASGHLLHPTSNPAERRAAGFNSREEVQELRSAQVKHSDKIAKWFGDRPGSAPKFKTLPLSEQVQTIKHILSQIGDIDSDSGLDKKTDAAASTAADEVKAAKKAAGLPATSAIEEKKPSKRRTAKLEGDRGAPRAEALELKQQYEELEQEMAEEIWVGDATSRKRIAAIRAEKAVLKEAYKHALGVQGTQDFQVAGDTRMIAGMMERKLGSRVEFQELDNGNYNFLVQDADTGELVPVHENKAPNDIVASHRAANDKSYAKAYQDLLAKQTEMEMELTFEKSLEFFKNKMGMQRDQAKAFLDAQVASAKGEDVAWINAKIEGDEQFVIRKGSRYFMVTEPQKTTAGDTSPGMIEIDPPF
jgi:hypothetical protein